MIDKSRYNYDFDEMVKSMSRLKSDQSNTTLLKIKNELNKFFKDSTCVEVIFTKNTDKLFFGMCVMASSVSADSLIDNVFDDKPRKIDRYFVEIDSKLLEIGLTSRELTSVLLHEVGHLVVDTSAIDDARGAIDDYMAQHKEALSLKDSVHYKELLAFGIKDTMRKSRSIFTRNNDEILADEFVFMCGFGEDLQKSFEKICANATNLTKEVQGNKLMTLHWILYIYKNMKAQRLSAIRTLNKCQRFTASALEKKEIATAVASLNKIDDIAMREAALCEATLLEGDTLIARVQRKGLKGLEDDLFEFEMRIRNVEDENDALLLMRQINTRMSVLDDYLYTTKDDENVTDRDRERWAKLLSRYEKLREDLSKKAVYNRKQYGLWADYNYLGMDGIGDMYR